MGEVFDISFTFGGNEVSWIVSLGLVFLAMLCLRLDFLERNGITPNLQNLFTFNLFSPKVTGDYIKQGANSTINQNKNITLKVENSEEDSKLLKLKRNEVKPFFKGSRFFTHLTKKHVEKYEIENYLENEGNGFAYYGRIDYSENVKFDIELFLSVEKGDKIEKGRRIKVGITKTDYEKIKNVSWDFSVYYEDQYEFQYKQKVTCEGFRYKAEKTECLDKENETNSNKISSEREILAIEKIRTGLIDLNLRFREILNQRYSIGKTKPKNVWNEINTELKRFAIFFQKNNLHLPSKILAKIEVVQTRLKNANSKLSEEAKIELTSNFEKREKLHQTVKEGLEVFQFDLEKLLEDIDIYFRKN